MPGLDATIDLLRILGDPTRLRLLHLLRAEALSVGELVAATGLPQPRVSTHLGRLRDAGLVRDRRQGGSAWYQATLDAHTGKLVDDLGVDDPVLAEDLARLQQSRAGTWADSVAGQMARHYSPGRTWEAVTRGLTGLLDLGHVLDIASGDGAIAELIGPRAEAVVCIDRSEKVVAAGRERLACMPNLRFDVGDMHALPYEADRFDVVLLMSALPWARDVSVVLGEAARVCRPGGRLVITTLEAHDHTDVVKRYDHANNGISVEALCEATAAAGFDVCTCAVTHRERRPPHFPIITLLARREA